MRIVKTGCEKHCPHTKHLCKCQSGDCRLADDHDYDKVAEIDYDPIDEAVRLHDGISEEVFMERFWGEESLGG